MTEKLSVIIPVYNVEKYLEECINSVINQTYKELEIILVDDGSTDSSGQICDDYERKDSRIKVIHNQNRGRVFSRYVGLLNSTAEYVIFLDSDDWVDYKMYETLMSYITKESVDLVTCGCYRYYAPDDMVNSFCSIFPEGVYDKDKLFSDILPRMLWDKDVKEWGIDPSLCMKIFKRKLLVDVYSSFKDIRISFGDDSLIFYSYMLKVSSIKITRNLFYYHRQRERHIVYPYFSDTNYLNKLYLFYTSLKQEFLNHPLKEELMYQLEHFYVTYTSKILSKYNEDLFACAKSYLFPFEKVPKGSNIVLYGAGKVGQYYYTQLQKSKYCKIALWVDKNFQKIQDFDVKNITEIANCIYDYIVIAIDSDNLKQKIKRDLISFGTQEEKII